MNTRIIAITLVLIFSICCLSGAFAENNEMEDATDYIMPVSITDNGIEFSDEYTGFCLDINKDKITADDGFIQDQSPDNDTENYVKLAIIECHKQNRQNDMGKIVESIVGGDYDESDDVIKEVLGSDEKIGNYEIVNINNTTQATFDFELLKSANENKSDCLAYRVSFETIASEEDAGTAGEIETNNTTDTASGDNVITDKTVPDKVDDNAKNKAEPEKTVKKTVKEKKDKEKTVKESVKEETLKEAEKEKAKKEKSDEKTQTTVNKTSSPVANETATTTDNQSDLETVGAAIEVPQNDNVQNPSRTLNPLPIVIILAAIVGLAAVVLYRKG